MNSDILSKFKTINNIIVNLITLANLLYSSKFSGISEIEIDNIDKLYNEINKELKLIFNIAEKYDIVNKLISDRKTI
jgi:hypothetical protein